MSELFDHSPLEEIDLDPFYVGLIAPKGAKNPYPPGSLAWDGFERGQQEQSND